MDYGRLLTQTTVETDTTQNRHDSHQQFSASIVDHASFIMMHQVGIDNVSTNDRHFAAAGLFRFSK